MDTRSSLGGNSSWKTPFTPPDFKKSDDILQQLVTARRERGVQLQKSQASHREDIETRGKAQIAALRKSLPKDMLATVLDNLDKTHEEAKAATKAHVDKAKAKLIASGPSPENETAVHPGLAGGHLVAPNSLGSVHPVLRYAALVRRHRGLAGL